MCVLERACVCAGACESVRVSAGACESLHTCAVLFETKHEEKGQMNAKARTGFEKAISSKLGRRWLKQRECREFRKDFFRKGTHLRSGCWGQKVIGRN